jgi:hypothetical protein
MANLPKNDEEMADGKGIAIHIPEGHYTPQQINAGAMKTDTGTKTFPRHDEETVTRPFQGPKPNTTLEEWMDNKHPGAGRISKDLAKGTGGTRINET